MAAKRNATTTVTMDELGTDPDQFDDAVDNPSPASTALILANPGGGNGASISGGKGIKGYMNAALPMLQIGAAGAAGWIGSNIIRTQVSLPVARAIFGQEKITPGQATLVDWLVQLAGAITVYKMVPGKYGKWAAGAMIANQVVSTAKYLMPTKPGQQPNIIQRSLDVLSFTPSNGGSPPASGYVIPRNRSMAGIMPPIRR